MTTRIEEFAAYFEEQLGSIQALDSYFYKKVLFLGVLDSLSRAAFPHNDRHHCRLMHFIDEYSGWNHKDRVSALQLGLALQKENKTSILLYQKAIQQMETWTKEPSATPEGDVVQCWLENPIITPEADLLYQDFVSIAQSKDDISLLKQATYKELLYTYRNHAIHEFREPGHGAELIEEKDCPYYHKDEDDEWQLVFPVHFLVALTANCLNNLSNYMRSRNIDPYAGYRFGTLWNRR